MEISLFDVLGPVMIGPSSSHTAGAAKLARAARAIVAAPVSHVEFALHGSFRATGLGHGTDRALVAGVLGLSEDDERLRDAFELAAQEGLSYSFTEVDLGNVHDNSVRMTFKTSRSETRTICGSSLGGARILITQIDEFCTEVSLDAPTIIIMQRDTQGIISAVAGKIAAQNVNIASMKLSRTAKGCNACCIIETDGAVPDSLLDEIRALPNILRAVHIRRIG